MGSTRDTYIRKLLFLRTRLRQPQNRRNAVRRSRRVTRNGSAVTDRIQNSSKMILNRQQLLCFSLSFFPNTVSLFLSLSLSIFLILFYFTGI